MSTIVILFICIAVVVIIGLRVYFEHKEDEEIEKLKQQVEQDKKSASIFAQEEVLAANQILQVEEKQPADVQTQVFIDVEPINSAAAQAEAKPKKKKRYYGNRKPKAKSNSNKQTKK